MNTLFIILLTFFSLPFICFIAVIVLMFPVIIFALMLRYWYITLLVIICITSPIFYFKNWGSTLFFIFTALAVLFYFIPLSDDQKKEIEQIKNQI